MAAKFGLCESYMARLVRTASLAPDIVEAILDGNEPADFSITSLIMAVPENWEEQKKEYGFAGAVIEREEMPVSAPMDNSRTSSNSLTTKH